MKKLLSLIVTLMLLGVVAPLASTVHASEDDDDNSSSVETSDSDDYETSTSSDDDGTIKPYPGNPNRPYPGSTSTYKPRPNGQEMIEEMKENMREGVKNNREEAKNNREDFRMEYKDDIQATRAELSDDQKSELQTLRENFESEMDTLRESFKVAETIETRKEIQEQMKTLAEENFTAMKEILGDTDMQMIVDERRSVFQENESLREENRDMRQEYSMVKREMVDKYRKSFIKRLGNQIDNIPVEKLETISQRIDTLIEKYETNKTITDAKKETMLSALMALKEIIEEKMEGDDIEDEVLDIVSELLN